MSAHASQIRPLKAWQIRTPQSTIRNPQLKGRADMLAMLFYADWNANDDQPRSYIHPGKGCTRCCHSLPATAGQPKKSRQIFRLGVVKRPILQPIYMRALDSWPVFRPVKPCAPRP